MADLPFGLEVDYLVFSALLQPSPLLLGLFFFLDWTAFRNLAFSSLDCRPDQSSYREDIPPRKDNKPLKDTHLALRAEEKSPTTNPRDFDSCYSRYLRSSIEQMGGSVPQISSSGEMYKEKKTCSQEILGYLLIVQALEFWAQIKTNLSKINPFDVPHT